MIPVIETERLILRGMVQEDFTAFAAIWAEPEVVRFIGGKPRSVVDSRNSFLRNVGSWAMDGHGQWGIYRRSDGRMLGQTGFFNAMRGLGADFDAGPEAGWVLTAAAQGQGFGPEAVAAAHRWCDAQPIAGPTVVMIGVTHRVSLALAARMGYNALRETEFEGDKVRLLARQRSV
jgi:RimJ/RimL family protein N-acetyltransferase